MYGIQIEYLAILSAVFCILSIAVSVTGLRGSLRKANDPSAGVPTCFFDPDKVDGCCDICFGDVKRMLFVRVCGCGRIFHDECAMLTDECPYCDAPYREMGMRRVRRMDCPRCGRAVSGSICRCGTVLPRKDGTFECICGNTIHMDSAECSVCGSRYSMTQININGERHGGPWSSKPRGAEGDTSRSRWTRE